MASKRPKLPKMPELSMPRIDVPWNLLRSMRVPATAALGIVGLLVLIRTNPLNDVTTKRSLPPPTVQQATVASVPVPMPTPSAAPAPAAATKSAEAPPAPSPAIELKLPATKPLELTIAARQTMWIMIKADGRLMAQRQLGAGSQESWKAKKRFDVIIARPSFADVQLNGQAISPQIVALRGRVVIGHSSIKAMPN